MAKNSPRPTLADVAKRAQVSITSVSRLINNTGPINEETRLRISTAMTELGFEQRRSVEKETDKTIAVVTGHLLNPFFPEIIRGIQEEADTYNMLTVLFTLNDVPHRQQQVLQKLSRRSINGIVLMGFPLMTSIAEIQSHQHIPMVVINRRASGPALGSISIDFENAGYRAAQHLMTFGHNRIGYLSPFVAGSDISIPRRRGIELAMHEAGFLMHPEWVITCPPGQDMDSGYHAMSTLLNRPAAERPTALVCYNDAIAVGAEHALRAFGVRVPEEMSIVGFDDIAIAVHANPPLTTISQPKFSMGMMAVQMLRKMMQDPTLFGDDIVTESPLIVRESTGPCLERVPS